MFWIQAIIYCVDLYTLFVYDFWINTFICILIWKYIINQFPHKDM